VHPVRDGLGVPGVARPNLFALRSTDPKALYRADDPVGPENDDTFRRVLPRCRAVVCAWGNHGVLHGQYLAALAIMREHCRPQALAITKEGQPQHPLYLRADLLPSRTEDEMSKAIDYQFAADEHAEAAERIEPERQRPEPAPC